MATAPLADVGAPAAVTAVEEEDNLGGLPYGGDLQAAMRAQDRDAIRLLMRRKQQQQQQQQKATTTTFAPSAPSAPPPAAATEVQPAPTAPPLPPR